MFIHFFGKIRTCTSVVIIIIVVIVIVIIFTWSVVNNKRNMDGFSHFHKTPEGRGMEGRTGS